MNIINNIYIADRFRDLAVNGNRYYSHVAKIILGCEEDIATLYRAGKLDISGIGPKSIYYIGKILDGRFDEVLARQTSNSWRSVGGRSSRLDDTNPSWDNSVKIVED